MFINILSIGTSLYFNGEGIHFTTKPFDTSKIEEFAFVFCYGNNCAKTKTGSQVSVQYQMTLESAGMWLRP